MRNIVLLCVLVPALLKAAVWPFFGNDTYRRSLSPNSGPEGCDIICDVQIQNSMASPVLDGNGHLYMQGQEDLVGDWFLFCVNTSDCSINWRYLLGSKPSGYFLHSTAGISPVDGTIYVGYESGLYAVDPTGTLKWSYAVGDVIESSPMVASDGTIYVGSWDGYLYALNPNGTLEWSYLTGGEIYSSPTLATDGTIYVGCAWDQKLHAINSNGTPKWTYTAGDGILSSPAVGTDGSVYFGCNDGYLYAVTSSGSFRWKYNVGGSVFSSPAVDDARSTVFVASITGKVCAVSTSGTSRWNMSMSQGALYSSPSVASVNNVVYIGDESGRFYVLSGQTGSEICHNSHDWPITTPAIDEPDGSEYCVWYNEYCVKVRKICHGSSEIEEGCSCKKNKLSLGHHPEPVLRIAEISFALPEQNHVRLQVYDPSGRLIETLAEGAYTSGNHTLQWNTQNIRRGIYFCTLTTEGSRVVTKLTVVK